MKTKSILVSLLFLIEFIILAGCSNNVDSNKNNNNNKIQSTSSNTQKTPQQEANENKQNVLSEIDQYEKNLTYEQLKLNPKKYFGTKVIFNGEVVQVIKDKLFHTMEFAIDGDYSKIVKVDYANEAILEDISDGDDITVYGIFEGEISNNSNSGAIISLLQIHGLLIEVK